jgi:predicted  nucleic acid-binding Zn-ribbon protein
MVPGDNHRGNIMSVIQDAIEEKLEELNNSLYHVNKELEEYDDRILKYDNDLVDAQDAVAKLENVKNILKKIRNNRWDYNFFDLNDLGRDFTSCKDIDQSITNFQVIIKGIKDKIKRYTKQSINDRIMSFESDITELQAQLNVLSKD